MNGIRIGLTAIAVVVGVGVAPMASAETCLPEVDERQICQPLNTDELVQLFKSAGFAPEEIEEVLLAFEELSELVDFAATNRLLRQVREEYLLDYAATTVLQVFGDVVTRQVPLAATDVEVWKQEVIQLVAEYAPGLEAEVLERVLDLLNFGVWGKFDLPLGEREGFLGNTITGSDQDGFNVPCVRMGCSHIEFSTQPLVHGKRWIWGQQMVNGGYGWPLGELNGGLEPTGRHPITDDFKVVLMEVSEQQSSAQFGIYFRICIKTLFVDTCSPYFIGPFPWLGHREGDWILVGLTDGQSIPAPPAPPMVPPPLEPGPLPTPIANASPTPEPEEEVCEGDLQHPAPGHRVTSEFGWRVHPVTGKQGTFHQGIDLATPEGETIRAACDGVVKIAGPVDGYGLYVAIEHGNRMSTGYGHLDRIDVVVGQQVATGDSIGRSGNTGLSTGPHLHFETFLNGEPRNPREYVEF